MHSEMTVLGLPSLVSSSVGLGSVDGPCPVRDSAPKSEVEGHVSTHSPTLEVRMRSGPNAQELSSEPDSVIASGCVTHLLAHQSCDANNILQTSAEEGFHLCNTPKNQDHAHEDQVSTTSGSCGVRRLGGLLLSHGIGCTMPRRKVCLNETAQRSATESRVTSTSRASKSSYFIVLCLNDEWTTPIGSGLGSRDLWSYLLP